MAIHIISEKCTGCSLCVKVCPFDAIRIMDRLGSHGLASDSQSQKKASIDLNKCNLCGACVHACKLKAVIIDKPQPTCILPDIKDFKGIWVFIEQKNGKIQSISYELLGKAHELAQKLNCEVSGVAIGNNLDDQIDELFWHGADNIYLVQSPEIANFQDDPYTNILVELVKKYKPEILLCGATSIGRSLVARVAIKIKAGLTADCTGLDIDPGKKDLTADTACLRRQHYGNDHQPELPAANGNCAP